MEKLAIRISRQAAKAVSNQIIWYIANRDKSFAKTLSENITTDIEAIASTPSIGRVIPSKGNREYRVFISHKKCLIKYWYNSRTLYVVNIIFTDIHTPRIFWIPQAYTWHNNSARFSLRDTLRIFFMYYPRLFTACAQTNGWWGENNTSFSVFPWSLQMFFITLHSFPTNPKPT